MPVRIPRTDLQQRYDPFEHEVWGVPVTRADVHQALEEGRLAHEPGGQDHAARIAYLVKHPASDPVAIDVGVPSLGCVVAWPIVDGNHRLAAAIYREDAFVLAEVSGEVAYARHLFGESCAHWTLRDAGLSRHTHGECADELRQFDAPTCHRMQPIDEIERRRRVSWMCGNRIRIKKEAETT